MIKKIDHIVITTKNIKECIKFYEKLGFEYKNKNSKNELFIGEFKINVHIKGNELLPHAKNIEIGSSDICFEISDNIENFKKTIEKKGIEIEEGIVNRSGVKGNMKSIYIRDYDGNLIELCSYK